MTALTAATPPGERLAIFVTRVAALDDVRADVEANHDNNRWWPTSVTDRRTRMLVAGWSTRVSYSMINTYERVVGAVDTLGFDQLVRLPDQDVVAVAQPLGLSSARIGYLRSLEAFLHKHDLDDLLKGEEDSVIGEFAEQVAHASYKVAQCALLYARGYHCGIIPVDSGMVTRLAPLLDFDLPATAYAHEQMRHLLQQALVERSDYYRQLAKRLDYRVTIPPGTPPSWWLHLVLIYFKRGYLNRSNPQLCPQRPVCEEVISCAHTWDAH